MARAKNPNNGHVTSKLEDALATLVQNQAILVQTQAAFTARLAETDSRMAATERERAETEKENSTRFARIEAILLDHNRILTDLVNKVQLLTDQIRDKIGFKIPEKSPPQQGVT
jgi:uncharacterized protein involved in exopolysaccharide biosynthesis